MPYAVDEGVVGFPTCGDIRRGVVLLDSFMHPSDLLAIFYIKKSAMIVKHRITIEAKRVWQLRVNQLSSPSRRIFASVMARRKGSKVDVSKTGLPCRVGRQVIDRRCKTMALECIL